MMSLNARRLVLSCILPAGALAALVIPSAASASLGEQCSGANIEGNGSTLQKLAQVETWGPDFNKEANALACNGTQGAKKSPTVKYTGTGSGPGMESWGTNGHAANYSATNAFVGTDQPPSKADLEAIEGHHVEGKTAKVLSIPTLQAAVSIIVHPPANCTATSTAVPGRLVLGNKTLEEIFRAKKTKWSQITESGDKLEGAGCNPEEKISRVVREEGSGTTAIVDKYFALINPKGKVVGTKTWKELAEELSNTKWPEEGTVVRAKGGGGLVTKVFETASSIGYANLADARNNKNFSKPLGGEGKATFWAPVQNNGTSITTFKYADPSTNTDGEAKAKANCELEVYTNGAGTKFPPKSTEEPWNAVTTKTSEKHYTICGFTYDLAIAGYSAYPATSEEEATTIANYDAWVLNAAAEGGQKLIEANTDYLGLPTSKTAELNVQKIAQEGAAKITF
jgi:ABC-type phosphate transport system substrate-binding protein